MKKLVVPLGFAVCALCISSTWAADLEDPLISKVENLKAARAVMFVSDCQLGDVKYVLMFRAGESKGGYAQIEFSKSGPLTMNFGTTIIENGGWHVEGSTGGLVSGPAQAATMEYLMVSPFHILPSDQLDSIYNTPSNRHCDFS